MSILLLTEGCRELIDPQVIEDIDRLGIESAIAQNLSSVITSVSKLISSPSQSLLCYISDDDPGKRISAFIKYGVKHLYLYLASGKVVDVDIMCVLDFYVSEQSQRQGIGKALFDQFLTVNNMSPLDVAYDRPSPKLYRFLHSHFRLTESDLDFQPNKYLVSKLYLSKLR